MYSGDDQSGKVVAAELIRDVGFDSVDAGPLRIARYTEPFALLIAQLASEGKGAQNWCTGSSGLGSRDDVGRRRDALGALGKHRPPNLINRHR